MSSRIGSSSFIPFDLAGKLSFKETPWKPSPQLADHIQPIPLNDPQNYRLYSVESGPEYDFVMRYFFSSKPHGYDVGKIEVIDNPNLRRAFEANLVTMNYQAKNPIFAPTWKKDLKQTAQRERVMEDWKSSVEQFSPFQTLDGTMIDQAFILPMLQGTSEKSANAICSTGITYFGKHHFFNPAMGLTNLSTDQGFWGSGAYGTDRWDYAAKYSRDGFIILSWGAHRPPLPVVSDVKHPKKCSDMKLLEGRERYLNHNMHMIPVAKVKGSNLTYYPCFEGQMAETNEYVFFDPPQLLPWIKVRLVRNEPSKFIGTFYSIEECSQAILQGKFDQVRLWLEENRDRMNDRNENGETYLFSAVMGNHIGLFEWLCKQNPGLLHVKREDGSSVLHLAMAGGLSDIAAYIHRNAPHLLQERNDQGDTPLYLAAFYEQRKVLETYIDDVKRDPEIILKLARTPNYETLVFLAEKEVSVNVRNRQNQSPLHLSAQAGQPKNAELFLSLGLAIDDTDKNGRTPLFLAVTQGQERTVDFLLERGASVLIVAEGGENVLHMAAFYGYLNLLRKLLPPYPNLIHAADDDGKTPLHKAVWGDPKPHVVQWLLDNGADGKSKTYNRVTQTSFNYTPLHWAAKHGHEESAKLLIRWGAELDATNSNGETPFELAVRFGQDSVARHLIDPNFSGSQDALFVNPPIQKECLEKFREALQGGEKLNQLLCLEKLSDLLLADQNYNTASLVLNSAYALAEKHPFSTYQRLVSKKLERIEGQFIFEKFGTKLSMDHVNYLADARTEIASIRKSARLNLDQQASMQVLQTSIADKFQNFFSKLVKQCCDMVEKEPPTRFAVVSFGDLTTGEVFPCPTIGFGIFIESDTPENRTYFQNLYQLIRLRILNVGETEYLLPSIRGSSSILKRGFAFDQKLEHLDMVTTPDRFIALQTRAEFEKSPSNDQLGVESSLVYGETSLHDSYQKDLQVVLNHKRTLFSQKWREERALKGIKQLNEQVVSFRDLKRIDLAQFYLQKHLYGPLQRAIHLLGMSYNTEEKNLFGILKELEKEGVFSPINSQSLQQVLNLLIRWKILTQLNKQSGEDISLQNLEKDDISSRQQILEVFQVLLPFFKACDDFALNRSKAFVKSKFLDQGITI